MKHDRRTMITRITQAASVGVFAVIGQAAGEKLDENTHIKLGSALAVACVIVPAVWWLSSLLRGIHDSISELRGKVDNLRCVRDNQCGMEPPPTKGKR